MIAFFSLWEIKSDGVCECVSVLPACACAVCECVRVCMRVCVTSTVDNLYVCIACLCPLCETGSFWRPLMFLLSCVCERMNVCVWLAPVDRLHDSRYSYGVLLCADAWPVWGSVCVSVRYDCVCGQTLDQDCESFCYSARFDRRCYTMHSMYLSSSGHLVVSGFSI